MAGLNTISHSDDAPKAASVSGSKLNTLAAAALIGATALGTAAGAAGCKKKVSGEVDTSLNSSSDRRVVSSDAGVTDTDAGAKDSVDAGSNVAFSSRQPRGNTRLHYVYTDSQTGMADEVTVGRGGEIVIKKSNHPPIVKPNLCVTPKPDMRSVDSDPTGIFRVNVAAGCVELDVSKIQGKVRKCFSLPLTFDDLDSDGDKNDKFPFCIKIVE